MKERVFLPTLLLAIWAVGSVVTQAEVPRDIPIVSIEATRAETTEPAPHIRVIPGEFTLRRKGGDRNETLPVWISYGGTATAAEDYQPLPERVEFAAGQESITLQVRGIDDDEVEQDETVIAQPSDPTVGPIPRFEVDPDRASATVTIHDSDEPKTSLVTIEATRRIAEETAAPLRRINLVGEFTVSRGVAAETEAPVWIHVSGTGTPARDYEPLPRLVKIPAGESSVSFPVTALLDRDPEGIETVIATVANCPPEGFLGPCYDIPIDESKASATVFIREDGLSVATLHITSPSNGDKFAPGDPISIHATAIHLESYISRVEFWAGDERIGESEIFFVRAPDPGTPIHHEFVWQRASGGPHQLTVRAGPIEPDGPRQLVSSPVNITVEPDDGNQRPEASITRPFAGEEFAAGEPVEIVFEGRDPDGYIPQIEFFADRSRIGEINISFLVEPPPGQKQSATFTWNDPMPGSYALTARATDNEGGSAKSAPVGITVHPRDAHPIVTAVARDALAVEPGPDDLVDPAVFRIERHGSTSSDLTVHYLLRGQAENGADYERLPGSAVIPAGSSWVDLTIVPLSDESLEGSESVGLQLIEDAAYRIGRPGYAFAVIRDLPWSSPGLARCIRLPDGLIHLCFPAPSGACFHLEESLDLRRWISRLCLRPVQGNVHFVDEAEAGVPQRFFRLAPDSGDPAEQ